MLYLPPSVAKALLFPPWPSRWPGEEDGREAYVCQYSGIRGLIRIWSWGPMDSPVRAVRQPGRMEKLALARGTTTLCPIPQQPPYLLSLQYSTTVPYEGAVCALQLQCVLYGGTVQSDQELCTVHRPHLASTAPRQRRPGLYAPCACPCGRGARWVSQRRSRQQLPRLACPLVARLARCEDNRSWWMVCIGVGERIFSSPAPEPTSRSALCTFLGSGLWALVSEGLACSMQYALRAAQRPISKGRVTDWYRRSARAKPSWDGMLARQSSHAQSACAGAQCYCTTYSTVHYAVRSSLQSSITHSTATNPVSDPAFYVVRNVTPHLLGVPPRSLVLRLGSSRREDSSAKGESSSSKARYHVQYNVKRQAACPGSPVPSTVVGTCPKELVAGRVWVRWGYTVVATYCTCISLRIEYCSTEYDGRMVFGCLQYSNNADCTVRCKILQRPPS
jgi:hypothetical protein